MYMVPPSPTRILIATVCLALCAPACNDPYSTRRIKRRNDHVNTTLHDFSKREASGHQRVDEARQTLDKWNKLETDRFNKRILTVGDYVW